VEEELEWKRKEPETKKREPEFEVTLRNLRPGIPAMKTLKESSFEWAARPFRMLPWTLKPSLKLATF
jgi:hypothetical protein